MGAPSPPPPGPSRAPTGGGRRLVAAAAAAAAVAVAAAVAAVGATADGSAVDAADVAPAAAVSRSWRTFTPQQLEGPFFLDLRTLRTDLTNGRAGVPLYLSLRVLGGCNAGGGGCQPRSDALVDVWHTDSRGIYSGFADRGINATANTWMRGAAVTRPGGHVLFRTIIPGWYPGRLAHVHVKVRLAGLAAPFASPYGGGWRGFTTQLYLPDPLVRSVYAAPPYRSLGRYDSDVRRDVVLAGNTAEYSALTMDVWPATAAWVEEHGLNTGVPERWGLGHVASFTLRLRA